MLTLPTSDQTNPLQITQLLCGEQVIAHEKFVDENKKVWWRVNTPQQQYFSEPIGWHGYPGWILDEDLIKVEDFMPHNLVICSKLATMFYRNDQRIESLSIGTRLFGVQKMHNFYQIVTPNREIAYIHTDDLCPLTEIVEKSADQLRASIIATAKEFVGDWYSWGGRSAQNDDFGISSVDCSALIGLSFLAHGLQIPRMSHEQFLRSQHIAACKDLQPCDLIFFASITKRSTRMDHVMLYLGDDQILETTFADEHKVRIVSFQERMGKPCNTIASGDMISWNDEEFYVYFGSFLQDPTMIQRLRDDALKNEY